MNKLFILIAMCILGVTGWLLFADEKTQQVGGVGNTENSGSNVNNGGKFTSKVLGWLGMSGGGDPKDENTWAVINGIKVPPMPDKTENDKTIGGIDINENGVRDDVERLIAKEFGKEQVYYQQVMKESAAERTMMMSMKKEDTLKFLKTIGCFMMADFRKSRDELLQQNKIKFEYISRVKPITDAQVNTPARGNAYADSNMLVPLSTGCYIDKNGVLHEYE